MSCCEIATPFANTVAGEAAAMPESANRLRSAAWKYRVAVMVGLVIVFSIGLYYGYGKRPKVKLRIIMAAPPSAAVPEPARLSVWIHSLTSPDAATRENAVKQLIASGDASQSALEESFRGRTTPSLHRRLRSIRAAIARADLLRGPMRKTARPDCGRKLV